MTVPSIVGSMLTTPFSEPFMRWALIEIALLAAIGGACGVHVVLRRLAFLTDALQHTVFPGIVVAFVIEGSLLLGAAVAAGLTAVLFTVLGRRRGVDQDAALAVLISGFFSLGIVVVSRSGGYQHDLTSLLFGRLLAVDRQQVLETAILAAVVLGVLALLHKELVLRSFDQDGAEALGYRVGWLDLVLNLVVAVVVVAAVRAVGTVLVVAFIVTPAAAARLLVGRVGMAMLVASSLAFLGGWLGLAISYDLSVHRDVNAAPAPVVVLCITALFLVVALGHAARRMVVRSMSVRPVRSAVEEVAS